MNSEPPDWITGPSGPSGPPRPARRTARRLAIAGAVAAAVALGGVAVAAAATSGSPTGSASPSAPPSPGSSTAPDRGPRERHPFLAGKVVSASGGTITITDFQGFQRTIHTSSSTAYEDGLTANPAAGTRIWAVGSVDSDKTSLAATRVGTLPERADRGPGRFPGGPGRGFPGHRHDKDDEGGPSGSPSPGGSGTPSPGTPSPGTPSPSPSGTA